MTLTKLNGNESGVIIAKLINALIDEKASIDLSDLDATGEQRFTDLNTAISTLNTALSTLTTTVNKKVEATVSLAANGYIKFDNGMLVQFGKIVSQKTISSGNSANWTVNYPITFSEVFTVCGFLLSTSGIQPLAYVNSDLSAYNTNSITLYCSNKNDSNKTTVNGFNYIAIGTYQN